MVTNIFLKDNDGKSEFYTALGQANGGWKALISGKVELLPTYACFKALVVLCKQVKDSPLEQSTGRALGLVDHRLSDKKENALVKSILQYFRLMNDGSIVFTLKGCDLTIIIEEQDIKNQACKGIFVSAKDGASLTFTIDHEGHLLALQNHNNNALKFTPGGELAAIEGNFVVSTGQKEGIVYIHLNNTPSPEIDTLGSGPEILLGED